MINLSKSHEYFDPATVRDRVHIVGCGSVGATLAEMLIRLGISKLTLWDFDKVEPHNLANQIFRQQDVGKLKTEALRDILYEIDPDAKTNVQLESSGWDGQQLSGYVFLAVDNIELRRRIVEAHFDTPFVRAIFDFRTLLESAQHYAADWKNYKMKKQFLDSMAFSHEEAKEETPVSACGVTLGVAPTVRAICAVGITNFLNFIRKNELKKFINFDPFRYVLDAF